MNVHDRVNIWRVGPHGGYSQLLGSGPSAASDQRGSYLVLTPVRMDGVVVGVIWSAEANATQHRLERREVLIEVRRPRDDPGPGEHGAAVHIDDGQV